MSALLTQQQGETVFGTAENAAKSLGVRDVELSLIAFDEALTRFANNAIHQNVAERDHHASIRVIVDGRTARSSTNGWDRESIVQGVQRAVVAARALQPDPDLLPLAEVPCAEPACRFYESTAACGPRQRAEAVAQAIRIIESAGQTAAGIYETTQYTHCLLNSRGVRQFHSETMARASVTAIAPDSSGWTKASSPDRNAFELTALARSSSEKARASAHPRELRPGKYTIILEPAAVLDLVGQMFADFSATAIADQRSFLNDRMNKRIFGSNITIWDDVRHPLQNGPTFDGEGVPRQSLTLVEAGVPREIPYCRAAAARAGAQPTGHGYPVPNEFGEAPANIVIGGGNSTLEDMIGSTGRGILVTRLWYIREVDPYEKIMTGMTRDGTFLVEDGKIVCGIRNFRFNQSIIELLNSVEALGPAVRASGEEAHDMIVPAMKATGFNFTEVTRF